MHGKQEVVNSKSPLEKHIEYMGGGPIVSMSSMIKKNDKLGLSWFNVRKTATTVAVVGGLKKSRCPFIHFKPGDAVGKLNHPNSTHIFNQDGSINEERWAKLLTYAEKNESGELFITEPKLYEFLTYCRANETQHDFMSLGKKASNGEWETYFDQFSEKNSAGVRFVMTKQLRDFYEDSQKPGQEVEKRFSQSV